VYYVLEYGGSHNGITYETSSGFGSKIDMLDTLEGLLAMGVYKINVRAYEDEEER